MPYSATVLTQTGNALSLEMRGLLQTALTASGKYTKVTDAFVSGTKTFDVWQNDASTDGYAWFLVVCTDTALTGRLYLGGFLEYDSATKIAKKALRGGSTLGFVDAAGYPLVSAGGAEMTFALGSFAPTTTNTVGLLGGQGTTAVPTAATGNTFRVLVTGQVAWIWWGTASTPTYFSGIGTYQNLFSATLDLKPLAVLAFTGAGATTDGGTVFQHPSASGTSGPRSSAGGWLSGQSISTITAQTVPEIASFLSGQVNLNDLHFGAPVGSRLLVSRNLNVASNTTGGVLGLAPTDFMAFNRAVSVIVGDTITINGKVYVSVSTAGQSVGLFVNTQPVV